MYTLMRAFYNATPAQVGCLLAFLRKRDCRDSEEDILAACGYTVVGD